MEKISPEMAIRQAAAAILRARQHKAQLQAEQARLQAELVKYYTEVEVLLYVLII